MSANMLDRQPVRMGLLMWLAGMPGVVAVALLVTPRLLAKIPTRRRPRSSRPRSRSRPRLLLALAVWAGVACQARAGLHAQVLEAHADATRLGPPRRRSRPRWPAA